MTPPSRIRVLANGFTSVLDGFTTASPSAAEGERASHARPLAMVLGVALFVAAITAGAKIAVPIPGSPVPMSLQLPALLLAGALLGPAGGFYAGASYVGLGVSGAPVFVAGGGFAYLAGPTGGYLVAFPLAAWVVGALARPGAGTGKVVLGLAAGILTVHAGGLAWLMAWSGQSPAETLALSFTPFLVGDLVELGLVSALLRLIRPSLFVRPKHG